MKKKLTCHYLKILFQIIINALDNLKNITYNTLRTSATLDFWCCKFNIHNFTHHRVSILCSTCFVRSLKKHDEHFFVLEDFMEKKTKGFLGYVIPNILGMVGLSCYILADTFFISKAFYAQGLAALNYSIPAFSFIMGIGLMLGIGGASYYSIVKAGKNEDKPNRIFTHTVLLGVLISLVFIMLGLLFSENLARFLGANGETLEMTRIYLKTILCFAPLFIMNHILLAFTRNDNAPNVAMTGMLVGSFSNIILDYVFIFIFDMGMFGAALATCIAPLISICILTARILSKKSGFKLVRSFNFYASLKQIFSLGFSALIVELSSGIVIIVFNLIITKLAADVGVAAYGIVANISIVVVSIFTGVAQGIQPLASQASGERNTSAEQKLLKSGLTLAVAIAVVSYILLVVFSNLIISWFNSENDIQLAKLANNGFYIYFIGFVFAGFNIVSSAFLSATQRPKSAFAITISRATIVIPLAFVLSMIFKLNGVWLSFVLAELISSVIAVRGLKKPE